MQKVDVNNINFVRKILIWQYMEKNNDMHNLRKVKILLKTTLDLWKFSPFSSVFVKLILNYSRIAIEILTIRRISKIVKYKLKGGFQINVFFTFKYFGLSRIFG